MSHEGMKLRPALTYSEDNQVHISAQSLDLEMTPGFLELVEAEGGVSTECFIARQAIRSVLGAEQADKAMKVTVEVEPITEEERVNR